MRTERKESPVAQEHADTTITLTNERGIPYWSAWGAILWGAALLARGQREAGVAQIRQSLGAYEGALARTVYFAWLARGYGGVGLVEDGLAAVAEALQLVEKHKERIYEAEVYRLRGELLLAQADKLRG